MYFKLLRIIKNIAIFSDSFFDILFILQASSVLINMGIFIRVSKFIIFIDIMFFVDNVNYPNNNTLYSEKIYVDNDYNVVKVEVLDKDSNVIRDRLTLGQDGVCAVVVPFSSLSGQVVSLPDIISRGFIYQEEASDIIAEAKETIFKNPSI